MGNLFFREISTLGTFGGKNCTMTEDKNARYYLVFPATRLWSKNVG